MPLDRVKEEQGLGQLDTAPEIDSRDARRKARNYHLVPDAQRLTQNIYEGQSIRQAGPNRGAPQTHPMMDSKRTMSMQHAPEAGVRSLGKQRPAAKSGRGTGIVGEGNQFCEPGGGTHPLHEYKP